MSSKVIQRPTWNQLFSLLNILFLHKNSRFQSRYLSRKKPIHRINDYKSCNDKKFATSWKKSIHRKNRKIAQNTHTVSPSLIKHLAVYKLSTSLRLNTVEVEGKTKSARGKRKKKRDIKTSIGTHFFSFFFPFFFPFFFAIVYQSSSSTSSSHSSSSSSSERLRIF